MTPSQHPGDPILYAPLVAKLWSEDACAPFRFRTSYHLGDVLVYVYEHAETGHYLSIEAAGQCSAMTWHKTSSALPPRGYQHSVILYSWAWPTWRKGMATWIGDDLVWEIFEDNTYRALEASPDYWCKVSLPKSESGVMASV